MSRTKDQKLEEIQISDLSFRLAKQAGLGGDHAEAKAKVQKMFPKTPAGQIASLYDKAMKFLEACSGFGETYFSKNLSENEIHEALREAHPGFSDKTYRDALSFGRFLAK